MSREGVPARYLSGRAGGRGRRLLPWGGGPRQIGWFSGGAPLRAGWQRTGPLPWQRAYLEPTGAQTVLIGPPGVGKSTVGRLLAGPTALDTDEIVAGRAGLPVPQIFARHGEQHFRRLEAEAVVEALETYGGVIDLGGVVSLGGGAVMTPRVREALAAHVARGGEIVWLQVDPDVVGERLTAGDRPLLAGDDALERWATLAAQREGTYAELATQVVDTTGRSPQEVAHIVRQRIAAPEALADWPTTPQSGVRLAVTTSTGGAAYPVETGHGVLGSLPTLLEATGAMPSGALVVHQPGLEPAAHAVRELLAEAGVHASLHAIAAGEQGKLLEGVGGIWEACAAAGLDRRGLLVAVGGGAATDVTGFAAATWMRGIDALHVPTTLLGMVDASVGGKTGINTAAGKNLVGTFHQPRAVLCDLDLLDGLPVRDVRAGLAEVVKCGLIDEDGVDGSEILERLRAAAPGTDPRGWPHLAELVQRALSVKARAVAADTQDTGVRELLNFGHTLGHALELVEGYRMRHGDAVALGMVYAAALGEELGMHPALDHVRGLLEHVGLPVRYEGEATWAQVRGAMALDKKAHSGGLRFVLLNALWDATVLPVDDEDALRRAWETVSPR